ncbi:MAG TPA: aminopeptidase P N-terminal domain-containing protein [Anaeromyxobacter sp.]|nr:aminopeptidase P N-terminal domain-containing protein [Anaeromyxobacter sp.]
MPFDPEVYRARRGRIFEAMERGGGGVLLLPAADERIRNNDSEYLFRQDSDYAWGVGLDEPTGCALFVARGGERKLVLFVRPRDREKEIWNGRRAGLEGAKQTYLADEALLVSDLDAKLAAYLDGAGTVWFRLGAEAGWDARLTRTLVELRNGARTGKRAPHTVVHSGRILHELRLVKSPDEVAILRRAADITAEGHLAAMRDGIDGRHEYQVQAEVEYAFRRRGGSGPGFGTIVAAGPNATVLHYRAGDGLLRDGELCLVDAGGEYEWYSADVTRTFPVSGEFTSPQRDLYALLLTVQKEAIAAVRPGETLEAIHDVVVRRLTEGLIGIGLLAGNAEERIADKSYRKYYMHRTSHWLGMDVHDVGDYHIEGKPRPLSPGMVVTVEPGLYVPPDDEVAPVGLRGVGMRIEDDVLVGPEGPVNLTVAIPKEIAEIEAACAR